MKQKAVFPRKSIKMIASKQTDQEKKQITSTRNENSIMISDYTDIKRVIRNINNCDNKFSNLDKMGKLQTKKINL